MNPRPGRALKLQTYDGQDIPNSIDPDPAPGAIGLARSSPRHRLLLAQVRRLGNPTGRYNRHGLVFASRRTNIPPVGTHDSQASATDSATNNASLFHLIEQVGVRRLPFQIPFEVHTYWSFQPDERGPAFEFRFVLQMPDQREVFSQGLALRAETPRVRYRVLGLPDAQITSAGAHTLGVEWRPQGAGEWHRESSSWPLQVDAIPDTTALPGLGVQEGGA